MIKFPDTLTEVGDYTFQWCENLYSVSAKGLKCVGDNAFENCISLSKFDFSNLEKIGKYSFSGLRGLIDVDCPNLKLVSDYAFSYCDELLYSRFLSAQILGECAFQDCFNMKMFIAPEVTTLKLGALEYNQSLTELIFPKLTELSDSPFYYCSNLRRLYFPQLKNIFKTNVFEKCNKIELLFAPKLEKTNSLIDNDCTIYLSTAFYTEVISKYDYTIIAPTGSYAEEWANENGYTFLDSESCSFTEISGGDFVYTCSTNDEICTMPIDLIEQMWYDYQPINNTPDFMTHGFLLDTVPDGVINAKDFARIINNQ